MASIVTVGSAVLDRVYLLSNVPEPDGGAYVIDYEERAGGVAANVACALAALGHDAAVVSRVGRDDAADVIVESLEDFGVDVDGIRRGDDDSSYTLVLRGPDGSRMIVAGGDSVPGLRLRDRDRDRLRAADCVFTSAYAPDRVVSELVELHRSGGIRTLAFDLSGPLPELEGAGRPRRRSTPSPRRPTCSSRTRSPRDRTSTVRPRPRRAGSGTPARPTSRSPSVRTARTSPKTASDRSTSRRSNARSSTRPGRAISTRPR